MTDKPKFKPAVTNKKPCEVCHAQIRATKGNNLCEPCATQVRLLNQLWRDKSEACSAKKKTPCA